MENFCTYSIVLFGDSITQFSTLPFNSGWGTWLNMLYERRADIINRGFSGYNTRWALQIFPQVFTPTSFPNAKLITLFFGANDSSLADKNPRQHVPLEEYGQNLSQLITSLSSLPTHATKSGHPYILLIAPPPLNETAWNKDDTNRLNAVTGQYASKAIEVAKKHGILHLNLWEEMQKDQNWTRFLADGLHLSDDGNKFLFEQIKTIIKSNDELDPSRIPMIFPDWKEVDYQNLNIVKKFV